MIDDYCSLVVQCSLFVQEFVTWTTTAIKTQEVQKIQSSASTSKSYQKITKFKFRWTLTFALRNEGLAITEFLTAKRPVYHCSNCAQLPSRWLAYIALNLVRTIGLELLTLGGKVMGKKGGFLFYQKRKRRKGNFYEFTGLREVLGDKYPKCKRSLKITVRCSLVNNFD